MSLGEKARLDIAPNLGFGARALGAGGVIPPNANVMYDVEILAINGLADQEKETPTASEEAGAPSEIADSPESSLEPPRDNESFPTTSEIESSPEPTLENESFPEPTSEIESYPEQPTLELECPPESPTSEISSTPEPPTSKGSAEPTASEIATTPEPQDPAGVPHWILWAGVVLVNLLLALGFYLYCSAPSDKFGSQDERVSTTHDVENPDETRLNTANCEL